MIYVNGDSFSQGNFYDNVYDCWPYRLGKDRILNDAMGGGSNYRIILTTFASVPLHHTEIKKAIIGFTSPHRYDIHGKIFIHSKAADSVVMEIWANQVLALERFFKVMNIDVYFFNAFCSFDLSKQDMNNIDKDRIEKIVSTFDDDKWILPKDTSLVETCIPAGFNLREDGHLEEAANDYFADIIKRKIGLQDV